MGMQLTPTNLIQFIGSLAPLMVGFFLLSASVLNKNIKGLIYLAGVMLSFVLNAVMMNIIRSPVSKMASSACSIIEWPFSLTAFNSPSWNSVFLAFTLAYMYLPMAFGGSMNYGVLIGLFALIGLDAAAKLANECTTNLGVILGIVFGLLLGGLWYSVIKASGNPQLLYFEEVSNGQTCSRPSNQKFKCSVYKNGRLVKDL